MKEVFDLVRQRWVSATPEEIVRQTWIQRMIGSLYFPREMLVVERELKELPHLVGGKELLPTRRIDLLCFRKIETTVSPLLLMECKEAPLTSQALEQALSYNYYVKAPYVAIVNRSDIRFRYQLSCKTCEISRLPSYIELMEALHG